MGGVGVSRAVLKLFHRLKIIDDIRVLPIPIDMHGPQQPSFFIGDLYYLYYLSQLMIKFSFGSKLALELHPPSSLGIVWSQLEVVLRKIDQVAVPIDFLHLRAPAGRRCGASDRCYNWWTPSFSTQLQLFGTRLKRVTIRRRQMRRQRGMQNKYWAEAGVSPLTLGIFSNAVERVPSTV